ncbi:Alpha-tubulin N-acetyltransferase 1 [Desmophyllum pertusum]|uniref:Alpha-tubulin N-acetyltransferase n=1 Tax=Desmophyllum pertusum TaxID=174260 RepID=A0A9W9ZKM2_9CNID|nr:Alpha-tubulin N-acetyltransferase 1 [Desmophyllum pertusum]
MGKILSSAEPGKEERYEFANKQSELKTVIDKIGDASTRAQGLRAAITSAIKLQHSDHRLYIMKDPSANSGLGAVVGILKVGHKKLFLLDMQSVQYEVNPLCVLDFYIHESRQRTGCGKRIFEHMLKMEGRMVHQLAIDRPSHKFVSFLKKYYGLKNAIPQANNFVIHEHFFSDLQAVGHVPRRSQRLANVALSGRPPIHPYKRTSQNDDDQPPLQRRQSGSSRLSTRPNSGRELSHSSNEPAYNTATVPPVLQRMNDSLQDINLPPIVPRPLSRNSAPGSRDSSAGRRSVARGMELGTPETTNHVRSEAYNASRGLAARATSYSRHSASRGGSADIAKSNRDVVAMDTNAADNNSFYRNNSGGRARSLHLTSVENPFMEQAVAGQTTAQRQQEQEQLSDLQYIFLQ